MTNAQIHNTQIHTKDKYTNANTQIHNAHPLSSQAINSSQVNGTKPLADVNHEETRLLAVSKKQANRNITNTKAFNIHNISEKFYENICVFFLNIKFSFSLS